MDKKEAITQLEIMATNAIGRLVEAKSEEERVLLNKQIEALDMGIDAIRWRNSLILLQGGAVEEPKDTLLPSGELLVDTKYANEAKSVRLMDREGFTRSFEERKTGHWIRQTDDYHDYYECEYCGIAVGLDDIRNYCPNCGARMEEQG